MEVLPGPAEAAEVRLLVEEAGLGMADLLVLAETAGEGQKVELEDGGRSWEAECCRVGMAMRDDGCWGRCVCEEVLRLGFFGDGMEDVLAGDGGTEGIFGVPHLDAICCCCCCCCCSCFCCCLNLDSWKKSPRMALRLPSLTSAAETSPTATPRASRKSRHACTLAADCEGESGGGDLPLPCDCLCLTTPWTGWPVAASMTSARATPSDSSVRRSRRRPPRRRPAGNLSR